MRTIAAHCDTLKWIQRSIESFCLCFFSLVYALVRLSLCQIICVTFPVDNNLLAMFGGFFFREQKKIDKSSHSSVKIRSHQAFRNILRM